MVIAEVRVFKKIVVAAVAGFAFCAQAAEPVKDAKIKMDEPMSGEMKKEGTKKRDVQEHAKKWDRKMKAMIEKEEKGRHPANPPQ